MNDLKGLNPVTEQEIYTIYDGMVPTWFDRFETNADVAGEVADLLVSRFARSSLGDGA